MEFYLQFVHREYNLKLSIIHASLRKNNHIRNGHIYLYKNEKFIITYMT